MTRAANRAAARLEQASSRELKVERIGRRPNRTGEQWKGEHYSMVAGDETISESQFRRRFLRSGPRGFRAQVNDQRSMINNQKNGIPFNLLMVPWPLAIE